MITSRIVKRFLCTHLLKQHLFNTGTSQYELLKFNFWPYRSVNGVYMLLVSMTDRIHVLAKRIGNIGEKAKVSLGVGTSILFHVSPYKYGYSMDKLFCTTIRFAGLLQDRYRGVKLSN